MARITEEDLVNDLYRLEEQLERTPNTSDVKKFGEYAYSTYKERFGTWKEVLEAADLNSGNGKYVRSSQGLTREDLIGALQNFAEELGRTPTSNEMNEDGPHSYLTYRKEFDSWANAIEQAGLEPVGGKSKGASVGEGRGEPIEDEELLDEMVRLEREFNKTPTTSMVQEHGKYSLNPYYSRWENWQGVVEAAGLD